MSDKELWRLLTDEISTSDKNDDQTLKCHLHLYIILMDQILLILHQENVKFQFLIRPNLISKHLYFQKIILLKRITITKDYSTEKNHYNKRLFY